MTESFESKIKHVLKDIDTLKTPSCLDTKTIGLYCSIGATGRSLLPEAERKRCEEHIESCLYCTHQLNEMSKLLYYHEQETPVSPKLMERLENLSPSPQYVGATGERATHRVAPTGLLNWLKEFLTFPFMQWRYAAVGLASACAAIVITLAVLKPERQTVASPNIDLNLFVNVRALADDGRTLSEAQGVVVNSNGLIASNLSPLTKASAVQITMRDGTVYKTKNIWPDENRNIAVMKIDNVGATGRSPLQMPAPTADISQVSIGEKVFLVNDSGRTGKSFKEVVVSDFKAFPGRHRDGGIQYIQLASMQAQVNKGALVDRDGQLIGLVITSEKNINLAVPLKDMEGFIKGRKAIPISELKQVKFSSEALNLYMKGILARDAQRWDQAMTSFKKALELNPNLEGAHLELGYIYYRKQLYDLEAREYEEALRINEQNTDAIYALATNLETRGLYEQAIKEFEKVIVIDPSDAEALYELGVACIAQGQKEKAMRIYERLKGLDAGAAEILKRLVGATHLVAPTIKQRTW